MNKNKSYPNYPRSLSVVCCYVCIGAKEVLSKDTGEIITCPNCKGQGIVKTIADPLGIRLRTRKPL